MRNFLTILHSSLQNNYSESEIHFLANLLLEKITGLTRTQLLVQKDIELNENQSKIALQLLDRLKNHEPIQYVLGETEFYGLKFKVNSSVLIPRPETEELVEWVIADLPKDYFGTNVLDVGTGSGCIPIALKSTCPELKVAAMDISQEALTLAQENAALNNVEVEFVQDDILNPAASDLRWNIIISNPPYIPFSEKDQMDKNVIDFEPHLALFVEENNPLVFYQKIAEFSHSHLAAGGILYFETHKDLAQEVGELLKKYGFTQVQIREDISGNERMVRGQTRSKPLPQAL